MHEKINLSTAADVLVAYKAKGNSVDRAAWPAGSAAYVVWPFPPARLFGAACSVGIYDCDIVVQPITSGSRTEPKSATRPQLSDLHGDACRGIRPLAGAAARCQPCGIFPNLAPVFY